MHEFSIASQIVDTVKRHACGRPVQRIQISIGSLSGVQKESLLLYLPELLEAADMANAKVDARKVPARMNCACGESFEPEGPLDPCPSCGGYEREIVNGKDCFLESIEVNDG